MCDTMVALPAGTADGATLFAKNSDRQRNEAHVVESHAPANHQPGTRVRCTYIEIPQAERTYGMLLCRPFWTWGTEMGANACGVAIGNEAIYAHQPPSQAAALTGMDLVRLGLERSSTASEAVEVITKLLALHGQGGDCGHLSPTWYDNGFLIADPTEAYVLETTGRDWLVERVHDIRTISNSFSIAEPDRTSAGLEQRARQFAGAIEPLDYALALADPHRQHLGTATERQARSTHRLREGQGSVRVADMIAALRDHGGHSDWSPRTADRSTLCMHAAGHDRGGQTTGALVSELHVSSPVHWVTATAAPCLSVFKPVLPGMPLPAIGPAPGDRFETSSLWWRHECFHRAALMQDFAAVRMQISAEQLATEALFRHRIAAVLGGGDAADRREAIESCWREASQIEEGWRSQLGAVVEAMPTSGYDLAWSKFNRIAGLDAAA